MMCNLVVPHGVSSCFFFLTACTRRLLLVLWCAWFCRSRRALFVERIFLGLAFYLRWNIFYFTCWATRRQKTCWCVDKRSYRWPLAVPGECRDGAETDPQSVEKRWSPCCQARCPKNLLSKTTATFAKMLRFFWNLHRTSSTVFLTHPPKTLPAHL